MVDRLMTGEEVAEFYKIPRKLLYSWAERHYGPPVVRIGKFSRYRQSDVQKFSMETEWEAGK